MKNIFLSTVIASFFVACAGKPSYEPEAAPNPSDVSPAQPHDKNSKPSNPDQDTDGGLSLWDRFKNQHPGAIAAEIGIPVVGTALGLLYAFKDKIFGKKDGGGGNTGGGGGIGADPVVPVVTTGGGAGGGVRTSTTLPVIPPYAGNRNTTFNSDQNEKINKIKNGLNMAGLPQDYIDGELKKLTDIYKSQALKDLYDTLTVPLDEGYGLAYEIPIETVKSAFLEFKKQHIATAFITSHKLANFMKSEPVLNNPTEDAKTLFMQACKGKTDMKSFLRWTKIKGTDLDNLLPSFLGALPALKNEQLTPFFNSGNAEVKILQLLGGGPIIWTPALCLQLALYAIKS